MKTQNATEIWHFVGKVNSYISSWKYLELEWFFQANIDRFIDKYSSIGWW